MQIDIASASNYLGQVTISGSAALNGQLQVVLEGGYAPAAGTTFNIISAGTVTGSFASATGLLAPAATQTIQDHADGHGGPADGPAPAGWNPEPRPTSQSDADNLGQALNHSYFSSLGTSRSAPASRSPSSSPSRATFRSAISRSMSASAGPPLRCLPSCSPPPTVRNLFVGLGGPYCLSGGGDLDDRHRIGPDGCQPGIRDVPPDFRHQPAQLLCPPAQRGQRRLRRVQLDHDERDRDRGDGGPLLQPDWAGQWPGDRFHPAFRRGAFAHRGGHDHQDCRQPGDRRGHGRGGTNCHIPIHHGRGQLCLHPPARNHGLDREHDPGQRHGGGGCDDDRRLGTLRLCRDGRTLLDG